VWTHFPQFAPSRGSVRCIGYMRSLTIQHTSLDYRAPWPFRAPGTLTPLSPLSASLVRLTDVTPETFCTILLCILIARKVTFATVHFATAINRIERRGLCTTFSPFMILLHHKLSAQIVKLFPFLRLFHSITSVCSC